MSKRLFVVFSFLIIASMLLAACGPTEAAPAADGGEPVAPAPTSAETIKIAILAPLSGPVPTFGVSTRDGILLAIEEWNAKGGVLGRQIEAIVADSQCTADPAV